MQLVVWGSGNPFREFLFVDDMASACIFLMENPEIKDGIFNIGTGEDLTIRQLAEIIAEIVGFEGEIVFDKNKPDGTPRKLLNINRMSKIGWKAKTTLREGIKKSYADFLNNLLK